MYLLSTFTAPRPCRSRLTETLGWVGAQGMAAVSNCTLCWKSNPRRGIKEVYEFMSLVHIVHCLTWVCEQMNLIKDINMYACSRVYWRQVPGPIKAAHVRAWNIKIRLVTIRTRAQVGWNENLAFKKLSININHASFSGVLAKMGCKYPQKFLKRLPFIF